MTADAPKLLGYEAIHTYWDNTLPPRLTIEPGEIVVFQTREPTAGEIARDVAKQRFPHIDPELMALAERDAAVLPNTGPGTEERGHALTGPVAIAGAEPGDILTVEILAVEPVDWGWTATGPGDGGGPLRAELTERYLHLWDLRNGTTAIFAPGIEIPMAPFCGVMGVAPAEPGRHRTSPPSRAGGNMDIRQLTAGASLQLPVWVPGALFSVGDAHAAQGDGEVSGTGIEMDATVTLRFGLEKGRNLANPCLFTPSTGAIPGPWFAATGHDPDLMEAARQALRGIVAYLGDRHGLAQAQAMVLASACVDLKISQVVNAGVFTVSAFLPLAIFVS
jgi:acetamidase/formamidase